MTMSRTTWSWAELVQVGADGVRVTEVAAQVERDGGALQDVSPLALVLIVQPADGHDRDVRRRRLVDRVREDRTAVPVTAFGLPYRSVIRASRNW